MRKSAGLRARQRSLKVFRRHGSVGQIVSPANHLFPRNGNQSHGFGFTRLESDCGSRRDVQPFAVSFGPVKPQLLRWSR